MERKQDDDDDNDDNDDVKVKSCESHLILW